MGALRAGAVHRRAWLGGTLNPSTSQLDATHSTRGAQLPPPGPHAAHAMPAGAPHRVSRRMAVSNAPAATCSAARLHLVCQRLTADTPGVGATNWVVSPAAELAAATSAATSAGISRSSISQPPSPPSSPSRPSKPPSLPPAGAPRRGVWDRGQAPGQPSCTCSRRKAGSGTAGPPLSSCEAPPKQPLAWHLPQPSAPQSATVLKAMQLRALAFSRSGASCHAQVLLVSPAGPNIPKVQLLHGCGGCGGCCARRALGALGVCRWRRGGRR